MGTNGFGDAQALALDASTPVGSRILWAGINGTGVFESTDGGATWTQKLSSSTPAVSAALAGGGITKVVVDLAPATSPPNPAGIRCSM